MTLIEHALRGTAITAGAVNRLPVGLPWYRSMPLSAVLGIELTIDGAPVPGLRLRVGNGTVGVQDLADRGEDAWFLQDRRVLEWDAPPPSSVLAAVVLRVRLQLPNLRGPDGSAVEVLQEVRAAVPVEVTR